MYVYICIGAYRPQYCSITHIVVHPTDPMEYVIIPSTYQPGQEMAFEISVESDNCDFDLIPIAGFGEGMIRTRTLGKWTNQNAKGIKEQNQSLNNPTYMLLVPEPTEVRIHLRFVMYDLGDASGGGTTIELNETESMAVNLALQEQDEHELREEEEKGDGGDGHDGSREDGGGRPYIGAYLLDGRATKMIASSGQPSDAESGVFVLLVYPVLHSGEYRVIVAPHSPPPVGHVYYFVLDVYSVAPVSLVAGLL